MHINEALFWAKVNKTETCWLWTASTIDGYGQFGVQRRPRRAHRISWELANGPIPPGLMVCHHCDNPSCVRPDHLFLGTQKDNMGDAAIKGRVVGWKPGDTAGEKNAGAKLTRVLVEEIRVRYSAGEKQVPLAAEYHVSQVLISKIIRREIWR